MSDTGKQSPLGVNVLGSLLQHDGFYINPKIVNLAGSSKINDEYVPGEIVNNTCLKWLTYALNAAWNKGTPTDADGISIDTYEAMINIGQSRIPALGNSPPPTYVAEDPSEVWNGEATSGYPIPGEGNPANLGSVPVLGFDPQAELNALFPLATDGEGVLEEATDYVWTKNDGLWSTTFSYPIEWAGQGQGATWFPFDQNNPNLSASQWGWIRLIALQAWNEFNWNGQTPVLDNPNYQYFTQSFLTAQGFVDFSNKAIFAIQDSKEFLQGVYSNMDDLTSSDITGVSLASRAFGQDLINMGKAIDLSTIATFGLPSNLLKILRKIMH